MATTPTTVSLDRPLYGAPFGSAVARFWRKYATFTGRASRSEYWWWYLVSAAVTAIFNLLSFTSGGYGYQLDGTYNTPTAGAIVVFIVWAAWGLATIVPGFALLARRLHDTNHSAVWMFVALVPLVGAIILLVFTLTAPDPAGARYDGV